DHFERFAGETALIQTTAPIEGRSKWTGKLAGVSGNLVLITVDGIEEKIEIESIKRAHVKGTVDFGS
ncbi:MAG: ribosome maturation factor RimP, partial [Raoultibacter sp.]